MNEKRQKTNKQREMNWDRTDADETRGRHELGESITPNQLSPPTWRSSRYKLKSKKQNTVQPRQKVQCSGSKAAKVLQQVVFAEVFQSERKKKFENAKWNLNDSVETRVEEEEENLSREENAVQTKTEWTWNRRSLIIIYMETKNGSSL